MTDIVWYDDPASRLTFERMKRAQDAVAKELMPDYELHQMGVNRNPDTLEVTIKLHFNLIGTPRPRRQALTEEWPDRRLTRIEPPTEDGSDLG